MHETTLAKARKLASPRLANSNGFGSRNMNPRLAALLKSQSFTLALLASVAAAMLVPEFGAKDGPLKTGLTTKLAVALIFLIQGLSLPTRQIARSATRLRLHAFCQIAIFVAAPLLMLALLSVSGNWIHPDLKVGFIYLSILPTTISSAIVMTSNSDGDSSAALFSTALSNVLGVFITPLLCGLLIASSTDAFPSLGSLVLKLSLLVLLPLLVGQAVRPLIRSRADASKKLFKRLSNALIVFIVFAAFCESAKQGIWSTIETEELAAALGFTTLYLLSLSGLVWLAAPIATRGPAERIAAFFCASQKTLAAGAPMAAVIFAVFEAPGLIILPIMLYHPLQLLLAGALSPWFRKKASP